MDRWSGGEPSCACIGGQMELRIRYDTENKGAPAVVKMTTAPEKHVEMKAGHPARASDARFYLFLHVVKGRSHLFWTLA